MTKRVNITIDGQDFSVDSSKNLLQTCLELGVDLSYFCWHPSLGSVGSCRQCAVLMFQDKDDQRGRITMACMTPVSDNMIISVTDQKAKDFRATNIEALMTNHPHDCPVCEEGGDCHLQDMTLMSEHINRRFDGDKRTHNNQDLGPLINHEMNRCIGCYRCVRFYRDYCGDDDLNVFGSKNQIYFGRATPGTLESHFSGNLCEVCPTGVFTDKTFSEHYARKWDLQSSPTICQHCSLGCNTYTGSYNNTVRKISNRHHEQINGHFLCDKGRFSYQYADNEQRVTHPIERSKATNQSLAIDSTTAQCQLKQWLTQSDGDIVALGSARASIENNAALVRLVEPYSNAAFYADCSDHQLGLAQQQIQFYQQSRLAPCSLTQVETADCALIIGEDVVNTAPRLALCIRQMVRNLGLAQAAAIGIAPWLDQAVRNVSQRQTSSLFVIATTPSELSDIASASEPMSHQQQRHLLTQIKDYLTDSTASCEPLAVKIAQALATADRPLIISGNSDSDLTNQRLIQDICVLLQSTAQAPLIHYLLPAANSQTLAIMSAPGQGIDSLIKHIRQTPPKLLLILEADLDWLLSTSKAQAIYQQWFEQIEHVVVIDHLMSATAQMADLILPSASGIEQQGCWLNSQGVIQLSSANIASSDDRKPAWLWCLEPHLHDQQEQYQVLLTWCSERFPLLSGIAQCQAQQVCEFKLARQSFRASGRTAINANVDVKEYPPATDPLSNLQYSMEGVAPFRQHNTDSKTASGAYIWQPKWNSGQAINKKLDNECGSALSCSIFPGPALETSSDNCVVARPAVQSKEFELVAQQQFYASNELSHYCPALEQLIEGASVQLNQRCADLLAWQPGYCCTITSGEHRLTLPCHIDPQYPSRTLGVDEQSYKTLGDINNHSLSAGQLVMHPPQGEQK